MPPVFVRRITKGSRLTIAEMDGNWDAAASSIGAVEATAGAALAAAGSAAASIVAGLAGKADIAHNQTISTITGLTAALATKAPLAPTVSARTADHTLVIGEANGIVEVNSASAVVITVPPNGSVAFPLQTMIEVHRVGAGTVTIAAGAGVTLRGGVLAVPAQWQSLRLRKRATDEWTVQ